MLEAAVEVQTQILQVLAVLVVVATVVQTMVEA
jgi:hypothetical protein